MSNLAKLSKQAVQHEHDRQFEKALAVYARLFDEAAGDEEEVDVALYNRAGDVAMRVGDGARAVEYYERAVDGYAGGGLLNNAIAVCNKLLRHAPDHAVTHYTLAVLHAKQGFRGDAKHHFVEYAERMHRGGRKDEALRALTEFAALCPAGDDARTMLAQHLSKGNRGADVNATLQSMLDGHTESAAAKPTRSQTATTSTPMLGAPADLVFLDVSGDAFAAAESAAPSAAPLLGLEPTALELPEDTAIEATLATPVALDTSLVDLAFDAPVAFELEMKTVELEMEEPTVELDLDEPVALDFLVEPARGETHLADAAVPLDLSVDAAALPAAPRWSSALPGELPVLSLGGWLGSANAVVIGAPADTLADEPDEAPILASSTFDAKTFSTDIPLLEDALADLAYLAEPELEVEAVVPTAVPSVAAPARDAGFLDLGSWLRDDEPVRSTRLLTDESTPTGDETADFERLLGIFRAGLARNLDAGDFDSHYDLGVAFREMGLIDEAISEFQKAAQAPHGALRAREALGQCFLDRGSPELAAATLERAVADGEDDDAREESRLLGVLYLLGDAHARLGRIAPARACFERVVANDIEFRDAATRLTQLSASSP